MIDKASKQKILDNIKDKDERMLISNIIDKAIKFEKTDSIFFSNFLNLNELEEVKKVLNYFKVEYKIFKVNEDIEKKNIAFIPKYMENYTDGILSEHISCIKIKPNVKEKLLHKDYMGAIYSLGMRREYIGDIIVKDNIGYFFCMKSAEEYFMLNLTSVGRQDVITEVVDIDSDEVKFLGLTFNKKEYIIPSLRVDALLSEVYNLSRSETKDKIVKGDLFINDKNIFYPNTIVEEGDIISFKRCGKLKVGTKVRITKSDNIVLEIYKYA